MVNLSKICKNFNIKMNKAVKSITILKRPGNSNSSIGNRTEEELLGGIPNITPEDDAKVSRSNEAMLNISQTNTRETIELSGSNEEILDLSQKVSKEDIKIQSNHFVLDFGQNVIKESFKLSESSEIELDSIKYDLKEEFESTQSQEEVLDLSQNRTKESKSSGSNEEILDLSQKVPKENIETGINHDVLDFSPDVTQVDFKSTESTEIEGSKGSNEYVLNITKDYVTHLPLEDKKITILKRPASFTSLTKNGVASSSPLENTNAVKNDHGGEFCEENASEESLTQTMMSSRSASKERKLHQYELKVSGEVKEETLVKPTLKQPDNTPNSSLIKDKHDTLDTSTIRHVEPIEKTYIENKNTRQSETTENIESADVLENEETKEEEEESVQKFTILKRPENTNDKFENNKSADQLIKTLDQRKQEYDKARIRIFGKPGSYEELASEDSPPLEQSNSSDAAAAPHVNDIPPGTPEHCIETPTESLEHYNEIPSNTQVPCKEIPNHCSAIYKKMSRNDLDFYNEIPTDSSDLPSGIQTELAPLRSNGSQHPLHYYNQPLPNFQPFYNDMSAYYCSQYGPFWSEGDTNYPPLPMDTEVPSYGSPFNSSGNNFFLSSEEQLFYTYVNGYHVPDGINDFSYDVHVDNYSSYDLSFTDFESTGVSK